MLSFCDFVCKWPPLCPVHNKNGRRRNGKKNSSLPSMCTWFPCFLPQGIQTTFYVAHINFLFNPAVFHLLYNSIIMNLKTHSNFQESLGICFISLTSQSFTFLIFFSFSCMRSKHGSSKRLLRLHYAYCVLFISGYMFKLTSKELLMLWSAITNQKAISIAIEKKIGSWLFFCDI